MWLLNSILKFLSKKPNKFNKNFKIRIDLDAKKGQFEELSRTIGRLSVPKLNSINRKANASFQGKFGEVY